MDIGQNLSPSKKGVQFLNVASLPKRSCCGGRGGRENNGFGFVICIIRESEFLMYILFCCDIRHIFQKSQIEIS